MPNIYMQEFTKFWCYVKSKNETITGVWNFANGLEVGGCGVLTGCDIPNLNNIVYTNTDQTITGVKIFTQPVIVPNGVENNQAVNLGQLISATTGSFIANQSASAQTASYWISGVAEIDRNNLLTTTAPGLFLINTTVSTGDNPIQISPSLLFGGRVYNGGVDTSVNFQIWVIPAVGSSNASLAIGTSLSHPQLTISSSGNLTYSGFTCTHGTFTGTGANDAITGVGHVLFANGNIGATNDNNVLAGIDINTTFTNTGGLATIKNLTGGAGYVDGTYTNVPIIDLTNTGHSTSTIAQATVVVLSGAITTVTPTTFGGRYAISNNLTISNSSLGGVGAGVAFQVNTLHTYTGVRFLDIRTAGDVQFGGTVQLNNYTVSTLPTGVRGMTAYVTDATTPTYLGTLTGGGLVVTPVIYNGSAWVSY